MDVDKRSIWGAIILYVLISTAIFLWVEGGSAFRVSVPTEGEATTQHEQAIKALDGVADVGIKLATTLVGLGAAVLLGFKAGLKLTTLTRVFILLATGCFLQSALYAVLWRLRIAELWINNSLALVSESRLQFHYQAHLVFFMLGLFCMGLLVASAALMTKEKSGEES
jgi:hypothetical protein